MSPADSVVYLHKKTISPKTVSKNGRDTMTMPELLEPAQNLNAGQSGRNECLPSVY